MIRFILIETYEGLTVTESQPGQTPKDAAQIDGGILVDAGPYSSYEEALDALEILLIQEQENDALG